jgi:hypothetical protein
MKWKKAPSVCTGGKPYFWTGRDRFGARWWICWDRQARQWCASTDRSTDRAWFDTVRQAMQWQAELLKMAID